MCRTELFCIKLRYSRDFAHSHTAAGTSTRHEASMRPFFFFFSHRSCLIRSKRTVMRCFSCLVQLVWAGVSKAIGFISITILVLRRVLHMCRRSAARLLCMTWSNPTVHKMLPWSAFKGVVVLDYPPIWSNDCHNYEEMQILRCSFWNDVTRPERKQIPACKNHLILTFIPATPSYWFRPEQVKFRCTSTWLGSKKTKH